MPSLARPRSMRMLWARKSKTLRQGRGGRGMRLIKTCEFDWRELRRASGKLLQPLYAGKQNLRMTLKKFAILQFAQV